VQITFNPPVHLLTVAVSLLTSSLIFICALILLFLNPEDDQFDRNALVFNIMLPRKWLFKCFNDSQRTTYWKYLNLYCLILVDLLIVPIDGCGCWLLLITSIVDVDC